jgi:glycosyltransferase involved in cell wall biosynthesis
MFTLLLGNTEQIIRNIFANDPVSKKEYFKTKAPLKPIIQMKILHINTNDRGGAAIACLRLHEGLLNMQIDSKVLLREKRDFSYPQTFPFEDRTSRMKKKFIRICKEFFLYYPDIRRKREEAFIKSRDPRISIFSYPQSNIDITKSKLYQEADIIHLHWVSYFLDFPSFFKKNKKPIVWTLHDMNPFTGGKHCVDIYAGIDNKGFPITRKIPEQEKKESDRNIKLKLKALKNCDNIHIVALSNWMEEEVKHSEVFNRFPIYKIPNGIDSSIFQPRDKYYSRKLLDIPQDKTVLLFVAESIENCQKGYEYLVTAMEKIKNKDILLCSIGEKGKQYLKNNQVKEFGQIKDERFLSAAYSSADIFITPSLADNLPNTVIESLLCGTPVIAFPVGGMMDLIVNGENGYLCKQISVNDLEICINKFLQDTSIFNRVKIRKDAVQKYDIQVQTQIYIKLYESILY